MKQCNTCGLWKSPSEFYARYGVCKPCTIQKQKDYLAHLDPAVKRTRQRHAQDRANERRKNNPTTARAHDKRHYERHQTRERERSLAYYHEHKEDRQTYNHQWKADNPEKVRTHDNVKHHKRRAAKRQAPYERFSTLEIAKRDHWTCHLCGKKVSRATWSLDHLIPLSRGGSHTRANVALAHQLCNSKRNVGYLPAQLRLW